MRMSREQEDGVRGVQRLWRHWYSDRISIASFKSSADCHVLSLMG